MSCPFNYIKTGKKGKRGGKRGNGTRMSKPFWAARTEERGYTKTGAINNRRAGNLGNRGVEKKRGLATKRQSE